MTDMPPVKFAVTQKIYNDKVKVDGFSIPLVGDLNGDGKPEIIGLGVIRYVEQDVTELDAVGKSIVIYDGQTGDVMLNFELNTLGANKFKDNFGYGTENGFQLRYEPRHNSYCHLAIADLDGDGVGEIVVTETGSGKVYALKPVLGQGKQITNLTKFWEVSVSHRHPYSDTYYSDGSVRRFGAPVPYISDLNGDGIPEVIVYNKIYNGKTGTLELELETLNRFADPNTSSSNYKTIKEKYAYVGRLAGAENDDDCMPVMAINDIDGDGNMEIIAGSKIYKPVILDPNSAAGNSYTIKHGPESLIINNETFYLTDGFTVVADIDGDDALDVIVVKRHRDRRHFIIYVWNPEIEGNAGLKASLAVEHSVTYGHFSVPFVGDINGRRDGWKNGAYSLKLPEICMTTGRLSSPANYFIPTHPQSNIPPYTTGTYTGDDGTGQPFHGHVAAFTYDAGETDVSKRLKLSWMMKHSDSSHQTGIVMFDFDADGVDDLVYRDEISLRVISPAHKADGYDFVNLKMDNASHPAVIRLRETGIASYTGFECPVVADVNGDGSADVITFAYRLPANARTVSSGGYLMVYEAAGESWAPARPVWNQGIYCPLQINDNLTVPRRPLPTLTKFYSKHPNKATGDTIRPFNGNWIQQPIVRKSNYAPILLTPDPSLSQDSIRIISSSETETVIKIIIENRGGASANSQTPVTFYHSYVAQSNKIKSFTTGKDIFVGETATFIDTLKGDYRNKIIYARVVDSGGTDFPVAGYIDCNPDNNTVCVMQVAAFKVPDIRVQVSPAPSRVICLTSFIDSISRSTVKWNKAFAGDPDILAGTDESTGSLNSSEFAGKTTCTYIYTVSIQCGSSEAKAYIHTPKDKTVRTHDTIVICQSHESSKAIYPNQILGIEFGGTWRYDNTVNPDSTVVRNTLKISAPSKYAGMVIFNAAEAWNAAPAIYDINHKGLANAKIFKFAYVLPAEVNGITKKELVIVVYK
jgi:hypothetical protein